MPLLTAFDIAGSGMNAQSVRLNAISSNLANVNSVSGNKEDVYRARQPVFAAELNRARGSEAMASVTVKGLVEKGGEPTKRYEPDNPLANGEGFIFEANVNPIEEMANMISASRSFQNNVEVFNTTKQLLMATLRLGQ